MSYHLWSFPTFVAVFQIWNHQSPAPSAYQFKPLISRHPPLLSYLLLPSQAFFVLVSLSPPWRLFHLLISHRKHRHNHLYSFFIDWNIWLTRRIFRFASFATRLLCCEPFEALNESMVGFVLARIMLKTMKLLKWPLLLRYFLTFRMVFLMKNKLNCWFRGW